MDYSDEENSSSDSEFGKCEFKTRSKVTKDCSMLIVTVYVEFINESEAEVSESGSSEWDIVSESSDLLV